MTIEHPKLRPWTPADQDLDTIIWWRGKSASGDRLRFSPVARAIQVEGRVVPTTVEWGPQEHAYVRVDGAEAMDRLAIALLSYRSSLMRSYRTGDLPVPEAVAALRGLQQTEAHLWGIEGTPVRAIETIVREILDADRARRARGH